MRKLLSIIFFILFLSPSVYPDELHELFQDINYTDYIETYSLSNTLKGNFVAVALLKEDIGIERLENPMIVGEIQDDHIKLYGDYIKFKRMFVGRLNGESAVLMLSKEAVIFIFDTSPEIREEMHLWLHVVYLDTQKKINILGNMEWQYK